MSRRVGAISVAIVLALMALIVTVSIQASYVLAAGSPAGGPPAEQLPADLEAAMAAAGGQGQVGVIVRLADQEELSSISGTNRSSRLEQVIAKLQAKARSTQGPINALLATRRGEGKVSDVEPLWIFNGFSITATPAVIQEIATRPEVASVSLDRKISAPVLAPAATISEPNINLIGAPAVWALGYTGQNAVVASLDTGVDGNHPDLSSRWRGGNNSWFDPNGQHLTPYDYSGHGTATMGVMVGGGSGGTNVGVAPGARWISAKIFSDQGTASLTGVHRAFQWLLDPDGNPNTDDAPNLVNNSWVDSAPDCSFEFQPDLRALLAAGIVPVFAAGNYGPGSSTSTSPANLPEAFAVGAIDNNEYILYASSRGPSACGQPSTVFPQLVAPGVSVRSDGLVSGYSYNTGTSFAAPHAAGVLALLLGANPNLTVDQQRQALIGSAKDLGVAGPDNSFGAGRIDALAAYQYVTKGAAKLSVDTLITGKYSGKRARAQFIQTTAFTAGDSVAIRAHAIDGSGVAVSGAAVSITIRAPNGSVVANSSPVTNSSGVAEFSFATSRKSTRGSYTVEVITASKTGYQYSAQTYRATFTLN